MCTPALAPLFLSCCPFEMDHAPAPTASTASSLFDRLCLLRYEDLAVGAKARAPRRVSAPTALCLSCRHVDRAPAGVQQSPDIHQTSTPFVFCVDCRYEDLAVGAEARALDVYARIGSPAPEAVLQAARLYDGCASGNEQQRAQCQHERDDLHKTTGHCEFLRYINTSSQRADWL